MEKYTCRCPVDDEGYLIADDHDDQCQAGQLQEWARRMLDVGVPPDAGLPLEGEGP